MKKKLLIILSLICLVIICGILYTCFYRSKLPVYSYDCYDSKRCVSNVLDYYVENGNYKISNKYKCKYSYCKWIDYDHTMSYDSDWLLFDNNSKNKGGYYFYNHKKNKVRKLLFDNVILNTTPSQFALNGAIVIDKNNNYGYYNLIKNKLTIPAKNSSIISFGNNLLAVKPLNSSKYAIYTVNGDKLTDELYDDVSEIKNPNNNDDFLMVKKDEKYNVFYFLSKNDFNESIFEEDLDYLYFVPNKDNNYIIFQYKNKSYFSKIYTGITLLNNKINVNEIEKTPIEEE